MRDDDPFEIGWQIVAETKREFRLAVEEVLHAVTSELTQCWEECREGFTSEWARIWGYGDTTDDDK